MKRTLFLTPRVQMTSWAVLKDDDSVVVFAF